MIYVVEEQRNLFKSKLRMLRSRAYEVKLFISADAAWVPLYNARDIDLVIVDVMLAAGGRYSQESTARYMTTGVTLVRDLLEQRGDDIDPQRILLFTSASRADILKEVNDLASEHGVKKALKSQYKSLVEFADLIDKLVEAAGGRLSHEPL